MNELKPCPFCGGEANLERPHEGGIYARHMCDFVDGVWFETEEEAIKAWDMRAEADGAAVLKTIDQLRRELSGYHGQIKANNDLQKHCDNQRKRIAGLESLHAREKAENAKLRKLLRAAWKCIHTGASCSDCRMIVGGCTLQSAMRELGIEV